MIFQIIEENGVKKIVPLTADTGAGAPVGSIIVVCSNILPSGYLGLGVQYDITNYPALYQVLGTDTTPTASALGLPTLSSGQYAIKATSGLTENQQENVLNTINENLSYSTTEHKTGKKWIDGKDVYECTFICTTSGGIQSNVWTDLTTLFAGTAQVPIDSIIDYKFNIVKNYSVKDVSRLLVGDPTINQGRLSAYINVALLNPVSFGQDSTLTLEYTKTNG